MVCSLLAVIEAFLQFLARLSVFVGIKYPYKLPTARPICVACSDLTAEVFVIHRDFGLDSDRISSSITLCPSIGSHSKGLADERVESGRF